MQDAVSHSIQFGSVQPTTQHHHTTGISIIETIRMQMQGGNDQESQLHTSEPEFIVEEEIGATSGIGK